MWCKTVLVVAEKSLFGQRMREARDQAGLTNRQIAERLATSRPGSREWYSEIDTLRRNLRRWLNGRNKPGADVVIEYARICGVTPDYFHGRDTNVMAPLMSAIAALVDQSVATQASKLRELVAEIPEPVDPFEGLWQACHFVRGRAIVAQAEVMAENVDEARSHLDAAIVRLEEALGKAKAVA